MVNKQFCLSVETLDWQATIDLYDRLTTLAQDTEEGLDSDATLRIGGRSLIVAQTTSNVAESAVLSTSVVALVILGMLVGTHNSTEEFQTRSWKRFRFMDSSHDGCWMGLRYYGLYRIPN